MSRNLTMTERISATPVRYPFSFVVAGDSGAWPDPTDGTRFVVSGGGGTALCSHYHGVCASGDGPPEDRGALFHAVQILIGEDGAIGGRVLQAFDPVDGRARITFGNA